MDPISYGVAAKQKQRIEKVIAEPDSDSGIVTTPSTIAVGETITIPAGRTAVLPNTTVNGTLDVQGEVFIPSGSSYTATEVDVTVIKQNGNTVVDTMQNQLVGGVKTFSSFPITPNSAPTADYQVANKIYVDSKGVTGVRQTVQYASIDSTTGQPNFLSVGTIDTYDTHDVFSDGSPVATYQLNGNANDLGGINNATATNITYSNGKFGQGAVFSGNSRVVKALTYRSMSLWVKFTSLPNAVQTILDNRDDNGDNLYGLQTAANNTLTTTSEAMYINGVLTASGAYTIPLNEWVHIALVPSANSTNMVLGSRFSLDQTFLNNAMVDQVRLFNRALTSDEVVILYAEKKAVAGLAVGVLATTKNIKISAAGGDTDLTGKITADTTITGLSASAINYLYADIALDGTVTLGSTTIAPEYRQGILSTDFPTWDTVNKGSGVTLSNGNLTATKTVVNNWANSNVYASKLVKYGKFYAEVTVGSVASTDFLHIGVSTINTEQTQQFPYNVAGYGYLNNGNKVNNASVVAYGASYTTGDKIGVLYDYTTGQLTFYKNGVSQGVAYTLIAGTPVYLAVSQYSTGNITVNYGASSFAYPLPSGAVAWNAERVIGRNIFDTSKMEMQVTNGTSYDKKKRVFLGEAIVNQGTNLKALGTNIGTLTSGGGLASAFDGNTSQTYDASAYIAGTGQLSGTIGKDWGVGVTKKVGGLKLYSPSNSGFTSNSANTFTFKFQASQDNSTWVDLYTSGTIVDSNSLVISIDSGIDTSTAYRYHRVQLNDSVADGASHVIAISELDLYEYGTAAITSVVNYALNGKYSSEYRGFINTGTLTKLNHNIGCPCEPPMIMQKCIQNDVVAVAGDELYLLSANNNSYAYSNAWINGNTFNFREPDKITFTTADGTTFNAQTKIKWNWKVLVKRSF